MTEKKRDIYLKVRGEIDGIVGETLTLDKFAETIACAGDQQKIAKLPIITLEPSMDEMVVVSVMHLVKTLLDCLPESNLHIFGEEEVLINIQQEKQREKKPPLLLVALVCLLLFIGSALAIMNFHDDVNMAGAHRQIYFLLTGQKNDHPLLLQIPYSLGIGIGMLVFFGFLSRNSREKDPSPLELEIHSYEQLLHRYVLNKKQKTEKDKE